jgi:hypothetical protein
MTPEEKAKELVEKYQKLDIEIGGQYDGYLTMKIHDAKQCALIAVEQVLGYMGADRGIDFWQSVKTEIEKI